MKTASATRQFGRSPCRSVAHVEDNCIRRGMQADVLPVRPAEYGITLEGTASLDMQGNRGFLPREGAATSLGF
jgi:hypothetical protein